MNDLLSQVAARAKERRRELPGSPTQAQIAAEADVSLMTIGSLERGKPINDRNRAKLSTALGWTPDSLDRLLRGEEPIEASKQAPSIDARVSQLEAHDAQQGQVLDELLAAVRRVEAQLGRMQQG